MPTSRLRRQIATSPRPQIDVADAQMQQVQAMLDYTKIAAPFDGVVTRRFINPGELVQASTSSRTTPLFTIQQLDTVRVICDVPEANAAAVAVDAHADVNFTALADRRFPAPSTRIAKSLNPETRTMRAEIHLKNPNDSLRPGMYAQVTIMLVHK